MGKQVTYIRRKQDCECYNGEELERAILSTYCTCNEIDYECDVGYYKTDEGRCALSEKYKPILNSNGLNEEQVH